MDREAGDGVAEKRDQDWDPGASVVQTNAAQVRPSCGRQEGCVGGDSHLDGKVVVL